MHKFSVWSVKGGALKYHKINYIHLSENCAMPHEAHSSAKNAHT